MLTTREDQGTHRVEVLELQELLPGAPGKDVLKEMPGHVPNHLQHYLKKTKTNRIQWSENPPPPKRMKHILSMFLATTLIQRASKVWIFLAGGGGAAMATGEGED